MKQVQVVYDNDGQILALVGNMPHGKLRAGVKPRPNQHVREMEVPAELEHEKLSVMHAKLRIDRSGAMPRLVRAS
jgi:hypothetical protein